MTRKNAMQAMKHNRCECGNQKPQRGIACDRCTFLDGSTASRVIPALRELVHANVHQIAQQADMHVRNVYVALRRLEKIGRVKRADVAGDTVYELISC